MTDYSKQSGKTTIDPEVLLTISKLSALSVEGVSHMASGPHTIDSVIHRNYSNGVRIDVEDNTVNVDLYLVMKQDVNLLETSKKVQSKINRAITEMVGMDVGRVNIHIEDIDYVSTD